MVAQVCKDMCTKIFTVLIFRVGKRRINLTIKTSQYIVAHSYTEYHGAMRMSGADLRVLVGNKSSKKNHVV